MIVLNYIKDNEHDSIELESLNGYDLSNMNLHRIWFNKLHSENALFCNANFRSATFEKSSFVKCDFSDSEFIAVNAKDVVFRKCMFKGTKFISSDFENCQWLDCIFEDLTIHNLKLIDCSPDRFE